MLDGISQESIVTVKPRSLVNARTTSAARIGGDTFDVPASASLTVLKLVEIPHSAHAITVTEVTSNIAYTQMAFPPSASTNFSIDNVETYAFGVVAVGPGLARKVRVDYWGIGSCVSAQDVNELSLGTGMSNNFKFPQHAEVTGNLKVDGDLQLAGGVDQISTLLDTVIVRDVQLILNYDGANLVANEPAGFYVSRKSGGGSTPGLKWIEKGDASPLSGWSFTGDLGTEQMKLSNFGDLAITGVFSPSSGVKFAPMADSTVAATADNVGRVYLSSDDRQFKGIVADGVGGYKRVVLG